MEIYKCLFHFSMHSETYLENIWIQCNSGLKCWCILILDLIIHAHKSLLALVCLITVIMCLYSLRTQSLRRKMRRTLGRSKGVSPLGKRSMSSTMPPSLSSGSILWVVCYQLLILPLCPSWCLKTSKADCCTLMHLRHTHIVALQCVDPTDDGGGVWRMGLCW